MLDYTRDNFWQPARTIESQKFLSTIVIKFPKNLSGSDDDVINWNVHELHEESNKPHNNHAHSSREGNSDEFFSVWFCAFFDESNGVLCEFPQWINEQGVDVGGWGVSARAELEGSDLTSAEIEIDASNEELDISVHLEASASPEAVSVNKVEGTAGFDIDGDRITVNPRYDVGSGSGDVVLSYSKDDTSVEVTASQDDQSVTISQKVDDDNTISPTVARSGDFSVEWKRSLGDDNSVTTTLKPNESVNVEWEDGAWTANVNVPIDGTDITGTNVSIKREVAF